MSRATQNVVLLLVGLSTGLMVVKGTYLHYVKPSLLPWLILASLVLTILAITAMVRDIKCHSHSQSTDVHHDGHRHHHLLTWLLLIPIAITAFVVPPPLGAHGAVPQIAASSEPVRQPFPPLPAGESPLVSLPDVLMRAATDSTNSLEGRRITITGFTMTENGRTDLGRVVIICCAADAQLARIHLAGPAAPVAGEYPDDTWLQVEGLVDPSTSTVATNFVATMAVSSVRQIDKPANTYTY